jgi:hypothetical protein
MSLDNLLSAIDSEIANLTKARALLAGLAVTAVKKVNVKAKPKKRRMSAAGRKAIAEAQRKRWAAVKKKVKS